MKQKNENPNGNDLTHNVPSKDPFKTIFISAMVFTLAIFIILLNQGWSSYRYFKQNIIPDSSLAETVGMIIFLDEALTMSVRMAAATGGLEWEQRYRSFEPQLDAALLNAKQIAPDIFVRDAALQTELANTALVELENRAFKLVRAGKSVEAGVLLSSSEYMTQKQAYAEGFKKIKADLEDRNMKHLSREYRDLGLFFVITGVFFPLLLLMLVMVYRLIQKYITERKQAEEAIAAEKEQLAVTLRSIGDGVITTDTLGNVVLMNKSAEELCGWTLDEAQGKPLASVFCIINESTRKPCENPVGKVLSTGQISELANHTLLISRDGTERIIADTGAPIKDKDGKTIGVVLVFRDMTQKQQLNQAIQRAQKLESLGVLAGGIAHDFNNLMGGIYGNIELANDEPDKGTSCEYLSQAMNTIDRARALTGQLITFARGGAPIQKVGDLFPFVETTAKFALSGSSVSCSFDVPQDLWPCRYDKNQIGQVIDNLIINAQQAMPVGGVIELTARNITLAEKEHPPLNKGNYVKISVKDHGIGIQKEHIARIFDPFFTTKTKGHGLGLATCYSIVNRHEGCLDVESEIGKGSTFHVYLPASTDSVPPSTDKPAKMHTGSGTFLVMDDERLIREIIRKMLTSFGYNVLCKESGDEAVELFASDIKAKREIVGMIFDLTVPGGMGGKAAVVEIRKMNKDIPVFVASGYAEDPIMKNPSEYGFTASICKPFRKPELSEVLNRFMQTK